MKYTAIVLLGPPGSGKGTQGKMLAAIPGFHHCSSGDIFRMLDRSSERGRIFPSHAGRGELVPDEFTVDLWQQYMKGMELTFRFNPQSQILVLDGIPRNLHQAELLDPILNVGKVIHLTSASPDLMVQRLRSRALKEERFDDADEQVIRRRLQVYQSTTAPLVRHYAAGMVENVECTSSPVEVFLEVLKIVTPLKLAFNGG
jgi:adenylate kinase